MATPHIPGRPRFNSTSRVQVLLMTFVIMDTVQASFNYSENVTSCQDLACANNNVCYTSTDNGTQDDHAHCLCRGEWAGLRCQSKLHATKSSTSINSVTLRIRGMTSSKPRKVVPMVDLHITDFSVSFWNLNGSEGCNIVRLKTATPWVTVNGLDRNHSFMFCVANGAIDLCRLKSSDSAAAVSRRSNCVAIRTASAQKENLDIGLIIVPIFVVIFLVIVITLLVLKRRSLFVQFILHFCCCRKCRCCCGPRTSRKNQQLTRKKHRNVSGNCLLPPDDLPFDDSTSFAPSFASTSLSSSALGNRSSIISDDKFPAFLEENPNPLYNPNLLSNLDFQTVLPDGGNGNVEFHRVGNEFHPIGGGNYFDSTPSTRHGLNSIHNTFRAAPNPTTYPYFVGNHNSAGHNAPEDVSESYLVSSVDVSVDNLRETNIRRPNSIPGNYFSRDGHNNNNTHTHTFLSPTPNFSFLTQNQFSTVPNGNIQRQFSCPPDGKSPPGAVRVFPHGNEWTRHNSIHAYPPTATDTNLRSVDNNVNGIENRRRRSLMKRRPLSYDLDYHQRYPTSDFYTDDMKEILGIQQQQAFPSRGAFAVATLPRIHRASGRRAEKIQNSPRRMNPLMVKSPSESFHATNTLPHYGSRLLDYHSPVTVSSATLPNGTAVKDDSQSVTSYPESTNSKDSKSEPPAIKKRVRSLISQFERTLPFLRHHQSGRNPGNFNDEEFFRDFASPLAVDRKRSSKNNKKSRPMSHPALTFDPRASSSIGNKPPHVVGVDPIFQGHPSQHFLPPFTTDEEEADDDVNNTADNVTVTPTIQEDAIAEESDASVETPETFPTALRKDTNSKDRYSISAFEDDPTNLITPFILKRSSSEESVDTMNATTSLDPDCH